MRLFRGNVFPRPNATEHSACPNCQPGCQRRASQTQSRGDGVGEKEEDSLTSLKLISAVEDVEFKRKENPLNVYIFIAWVGTFWVILPISLFITLIMLGWV